VSKKHFQGQNRRRIDDKKERKKEREERKKKDKRDKIKQETRRSMIFM